MKVLSIFLLVALSVTFVLAGSSFSLPNRANVRDILNKLKLTKPARMPAPRPVFDDSNPFFNRFKFFGLNMNCVVDELDRGIITGYVKSIWVEFVNFAADAVKPCMDIKDENEKYKCITDATEAGDQIFNKFNDAMNKEPSGVDILMGVYGICQDDYDF